MCLATITVICSPSAPVEVRDVTHVDFQEGYVLVSTLFGEQHRFDAVAIRNIDTRKGVTILFEEEKSP